MRVQERRGFESTSSTIEVPSSPNYEKSAFERRRRTLQGSSAHNFMNDATDQKIPRIIRPIPDEMEEFNLKGSISVE